MSSVPARRPWLPDLCRLPAVVTIMVAAESAVLVLLLAPGAEDWTITRFAAASLFAQWLALASGLLLCRGSGWLHRRSQAISVLLAWLVPVVVAALGSWMLQRADSQLGLRMTVPDSEAGGFVVGCAAVTAVVSAATLHYFHVQQQWARQIQAKAEAEVRALQARIRPHFLFNSINSIASLLRRDPQTAERALENLADLFRAALGAGQTPGTLDEELTLTERYLAIEKLRLGDRLRVEWRLHDPLPRGLVMPRLILQPLVENAIVHGIARIEEGGCMLISALVDKDHLRIRIGNPLPPQRAVSGNTHAQGSIEQRLRHHFGAAARVTIVQRADYYECELSLPLTGVASAA